ncbi:MAG: GNAT family N-acetyltransferase [Candidatus Lustribacter sp.]|jgi:DNA-binding MarR family transcriptional regulator/ribosomal protein S18 acetylase RimI-like enzyme
MATVLDRRVDEVRRFNRFYTKRIGVLAENFLRSPFTLAEGRVLHELANRETPSASDVAAALELDPGYLSRILRRFERAGLVTRIASPTDGRRTILALTSAGREAYAPLNERSHDEIAALLAPLGDERQGRVLDAMATIADALAPQDASGEIVLRDPVVGDYGWVIERHGVLYGNEYGFDAHMEGYVAEVIAAYVAGFQPERDRCWIAERHGARCGSIFAVHDDADSTVARLRLLLLEPSARGHGLGRRLVRECIAFARAAGYRKMVLWTHSILTTARAIYASEGFVMTATESNDLWGPHLTSETWELNLSSS